MDCREVESLLLDYVEGGLASGDQQVVEEHLRGCPACRAAVSQMRSVVEMLREADLSSGEAAGAREEAASRAEPAGTCMGDFRIEGVAGRGGMGVVYRARQVSLNRVVALKVFTPGPVGQDVDRRRFEVEMQAAARLRHPNIVPVYAQGEHEGRLFYAMEFIEGRPLSVHLAEMRERVWASGTGRAREYYREVARRMAEVAEALDYAHRCGIVHRDIKPSNLLVDADGRLRVADFGLARMAEEPGVTLSGDAPGTPAYMAPEQISRRFGDVGPATDVYGLGATLYEALTFRRPFDGRTRAEVMAQILREEPPAPRRIDPRLPVDLETICLRALAKRPERRYPSAAALAEDLRRFLTDRPILSRRAGPVLRASKWVHRHPTASAVAGGALVVLLLVGLVWRQVAASRYARANRLVDAALNVLLYEDYRLSDRARGLLEEAEPLGPDRASYELARGLAHILDALPAKREPLERALAAAPDDRRVLYALAWALRDERPEEAARFLERADAAGGPRTAAEWFLRGQAVLRLAGDPVDEALRCYRRAIEARRAAGHRDYLQASLHLGRSLNYWLFRARDISDPERRALFQQRFDEAFTHLSAVDLSWGTHGYPSYLLSIACRIAAEAYRSVSPAQSERYYAQSLGFARQAQQREPDGALGWIAEAEWYESRGEYERAVAAYTAALERAEASGSRSRQAEIYHYRWRLHFWLGDWEAALRDLEAEDRLTREAGLSFDRLWMRGLLRPVVLASGGQWGAAREEAAQVASLSEGGAMARLAGCAGLLALGDVEAGERGLSAWGDEHRGGRGLWPYEDTSWMETLAAFGSGEADWEAVRAKASEIEDPSWRLAAAYLIAGLRDLAQGSRDDALAWLRKAVGTYDYERYSYLAKALLIKAEQDTGWPGWVVPRDRR